VFFDLQFNALTFRLLAFHRIDDVVAHNPQQRHCFIRPNPFRNDFMKSAKAEDFTLINERNGDHGFRL
jgi:hypothetical protein